VSADLVLLFATTVAFCLGLSGTPKPLSPNFYAHSLEGEPPEKWQGLKEHLLNAARLAARLIEARWT
jgi:hypothetical protein